MRKQWNHHLHRLHRPGLQSQSTTTTTAGKTCSVVSDAHQDPASSSSSSWLAVTKHHHYHGRQNMLSRIWCPPGPCKGDIVTSTQQKEIWVSGVSHHCLRPPGHRAEAGSKASPGFLSILTAFRRHGPGRTPAEALASQRDTLKTLLHAWLA